MNDKLYSEQNFSTLVGVRSAFEDRRLTDYIIRNENLEEDLLEAIAQAGYQLSEHDQERLLAASKSKINASKRRAAEYYYDEETVALVGERESFVIESNGYQPPRL